MAKVFIEESTLTNIGDAIRSKTGKTALIPTLDMPDEIRSISSGGGNTLKNLLDATQSAQYLFYDYHGSSVDDLIQPSDTSNVTKMTQMFRGCWIHNAPQLNTSNVTKMDYMFDGCSSLTTIPQYDTSRVTNMWHMFSDCSSLTTIPLLDTSNVTDTSWMFQNCTKLTTIPKLNTWNVIDMSGMFDGCQNLTSIPKLNTGIVTSMSRMFRNCTKLKSILMTNIGANLDISASTQFERTDLVTILNNLATVTETKTLTMGVTNLAKLTDEDKAIATNKGWTLA